MSKIASMRRTASAAIGEMTGAPLRRFSCAATLASSKNLRRAHSDRHAAVHSKVLPRHVGGCVGQEEADRLSDFERVTETAERDLRKIGLLELVASDRLRHRRFDDTEAHGVYANAILGLFSCRRHGQPQDSGLGRTVVDLPDRPSPAGIGRDVDDGALCRAASRAIGRSLRPTA